MKSLTTIKVSDEMRRRLAERQASRAHGHEWDASKQARSDEDHPAIGAKQ